MKNNTVRYEEEVFETLTDGGEEDEGKEETTEEGKEEEGKEVDLDKAKDQLYGENKAEGEEGAEEKSEEEENKAEKEEKEEEKEPEEEKKAEKEEDKEEKKEDAPDVVTAEDLVFPEGVQVDEGIQKEFLDIANDKDMSSKDRANALVALQTKLYQAQVEGHQALMNSWVDTVKADKEMIGDSGKQLTENLAVAKKGMEALKVDGLAEVLEQSGYGSHPAFVKAFYRIGKAIGEDSFRLGGAGADTTTKEAKNILYPSADKA
jgi:hypothetical protein|tara:strand:+ start:4430 stop:5215 length:786 start_codon:yes stop_codon:yes gene_type:complete